METSPDAGVTRMRVTMDHFKLPAEEISRLWALQDKYVDLLEIRLRTASHRVQVGLTKLIRKDKELGEMAAQIKQLKDSRISELGLSGSISTFWMEYFQETLLNGLFEGDSIQNVDIMVRE